MPNAVKIKTTIVCTSVRREYFDWLPPLGLSLDPDQEFTYNGDVFDWLRTRGSGSVSENAVKAMQYAFDNELVEIKSGPSLVTFDETAGKSQMLKVDDGALIMSDVDGTNPVLVGPPAV